MRTLNFRSLLNDGTYVYGESVVEINRIVMNSDSTVVKTEIYGMAFDGKVGWYRHD